MVAMDNHELRATGSTQLYTSATELAAAIHAKHVSSEEVVNAYLRHIEVVNPRLNAVVQVAAASARIQAREADAALARGER